MAKEFTQVGVYQTEPEAYIGKGLLETAGIEAFIRIDDVGGMHPQLQYSRGVRLMVRTEDAEEARRILESAPEAELPGDVGEEPT